MDRLITPVAVDIKDASLNLPPNQSLFAAPHRNDRLDSSDYIIDTYREALCNGAGHTLMGEYLYMQNAVIVRMLPVFSAKR